MKAEVTITLNFLTLCLEGESSLWSLCAWSPLIPESPDLSADSSDRGDASGGTSGDIFVSTASG